jgi:hypothetical protein
MLGCSSTHKDQVDFSLFGHPGLYPSQEAMDRVMHVHFRKELDVLWKLSCEERSGDADVETGESEAGLLLNWRDH